MSTYNIEGLDSNALADVDLAGITRSNWSGPFNEGDAVAKYKLNTTDSRTPGLIVLKRTVGKDGRINLNVEHQLTTTCTDGDGNVIYDVARAYWGVNQPPFANLYEPGDTLVHLTNAFSILLAAAATGAPTTTNLIKLLAGNLTLGA